jgi:hypothetical protein
MDPFLSEVEVASPIRGYGAHVTAMEIAETRPSDEKATVLLIEDEAAVVDVGVKFLERVGYRALSAMTGLQALEISSRNEAYIVVRRSDER